MLEFSTPDKFLQANNIGIALLQILQDFIWLLFCVCLVIIETMSVERQHLDGVMRGFRLKWMKRTIGVDSINANQKCQQGCPKETTPKHQPKDKEE
jgi:hypothetical protein